MTAHLVSPTAAVADSFRDAMAEFRAEGRLGPDDRTELAAVLAAAGDITGADGFAALLDVLAARTVGDTELGVPSTTLWLVDGPEFLGRISVRHRLTVELRRRGGHIGYDVRPSARGRGHAGTMLRAMLLVAAGLGIEHALLSCAATNIPSRRVIESAGGVREPDGTEEPAGPAMLRYRVPTRPTT